MTDFIRKLTDATDPTKRRRRPTALAVRVAQALKRTSGVSGDYDLGALLLLMYGGRADEALAGPATPELEKMVAAMERHADALLMAHGAAKDVWAAASELFPPPPIN